MGPGRMQAFAALVLLTVSLFAHFLCKPLENRMLNRLETLTLLALCVTQACSVFTLLDATFVKRDKVTAVQWPDVFMVLLNVIVIGVLALCAIQELTDAKQRCRGMLACVCKFFGSNMPSRQRSYLFRPGSRSHVENQMRSSSVGHRRRGNRGTSDLFTGSPLGDRLLEHEL